MKSRTLIVLACASLTLGLENFVIQPRPAGAESEAGLEAPMIANRRRGRRWGGYGRTMQDPQVKYQQQQAAKNLRNDQMEENKHARQLQHLHKKDIIHNYGRAKNTNP